MNASEDNEPGRLPSVSSPSPGRASLSASPEVEGYKILRVLGEGGMGIVYLARQKHPVQRQVALKIVKPGMDSKQVVTRFEAERQALALLDHPNIAQVYDAGTTKDGHPYFSMEYVEGTSITEHCDKHRLSIEERLQLFVQVCDGVQHAHQKGIIHRDIKPSNILVYTEGDKALPKIIDFGVAKAVTVPLTEQTFFTQQGQLLGTPEYMSPEQTEMAEQDVDTRSDVYSLGVLLYVLLTGALPFERRELAKAGFVEILRTIREQDPPRPSTRLSGLADETTQAATNRNTTRGTLTRLVRGDLDWIVMKALEKDRNRRYSTTSELAADIKRHLNNEPVQAGPPTISYKFRKFIRRHRVAALAALLVAASLVTGTLLATYGLYRAYIARDRAVEAERNAVAQQQEAEKQRNEAEKQRNQAKRNLYRAHMLLAQKNWEDGLIGRLQEILDSHHPQPGEQDLRGWEWYYFKSLCNQNLLTFSGHKDAVRSVSWSPDGRYIASASTDNSVRIWDWLAKKEICVLRGHTKNLDSVVWSPDSQQLASGGNDGTVRIWDWTNRRIALTLTGHKGEVHSVTWSPDGQRIASGGLDSFVRIWSAKTGQEDLCLSCESRSRAILSLAWSPDGQWLAAGHESISEEDNGTITLWDMTTLQHRHFYDHEKNGQIRSISWSPDSRLLASAQAQGIITVWDRAAGKKKLLLRDHKQKVSSVMWSSDGKRLLSTGEDKTIKIWDLATKEVMVTLYGHRENVESAVWSPDLCYIASGSEDGTIKIWDAIKAKEPVSERQFSSQVRSVSWSPDSRRIATAYGTTVEIWDVVSGQDVLNLQGHTDAVCDVAWSPDGKRLATASKDKTIKVWSAAGGSPKLTLRGHSGQVYIVSWSPDGKKLASRGFDNNLIVWDAETGDVIFTLPVEGSGRAPQVAWSPDGRCLASGQRNQFMVWDASSGKTLHVLGDKSAVRSVTWSPDGKQLAVGKGNGKIQLWEVSNERLVFALQGHADRVRSIVWSPDGERLATASGDGTVKIRKANTGEEMLILLEHEAEVSSVAWSPDGKRLACGSSDSTVKIWDASLGYELESGSSLRSIWEAIETHRLDEVTLATENFRSSSDRADIERRVGRMDIHYAMQPPVIDGKVDPIWAVASTQSMVPQGNPADASGSWKALYDSENLYVIVEITDDSLVNDSARSWEDDSVEFYFDGGNTKEGPPLKADNRQYAFGWTSKEIQGNNIQIAGVEHAQVTTATGWCVEIKLPWLSLQGVIPQAGDLIGIDCFYNDDDDGGTTRETQIFTFATDANAWNDASQWGTAILAAIPEPVNPGTGQEDPSLAIYYSFDKVGETVLDQSGKHHDAIVVGDVLAESEGKFGGAVNFTSDGYLDLGGPDFSANDIPTSAITLTAWVRCKDTGGHHAIFSARSLDGTWLIHPELRNNGQFRWLLRSHGNSTIFDISAGGLKWDQWLHFAGTYDKTSGKAALYINGKLVREIDVARPGDIARDWDLGARIGTTIDGTRPFTGLMDELRIFTRALSQDEITKIMQGM